MDQSVMTPADYSAIFKRRLWSFFLPAIGISVLAILIALLLPPIYQSGSTILIEEQEIPSEYVMTTVTSYAEQRLQMINQRIMSTSRLTEIIDRFSLYADLKDKMTKDEIVDKMREAITMETINVDVVDRRTGRPSTATIAFILSYEGEERPAVIQQVATVLASLFLEENLKEREKQVVETSQFFGAELEKVKVELDKLDTLIAAYKEKHVNNLPELLQVNMQSLATVEHTLERLNEQLSGFKERESYLQTQLANVSPDLELGPHENADEERLELLRLELNRLKTEFSESYPDIIMLKQEIVGIEEKLTLEEGKDAEEGELPDNPAYINLASQLSSTRSEVGSVQRQISEFTKKAEEYRQRIATTPQIEKEYKSLLNERAGTQAKYEDLMRKHMEAKVAQGLEKEQKGEKFTLIDPAALPEKPFKPNRLAIILIGLVLGIGGGLGFASLREFSDDSIRGSDQLAMLSSAPVLANIPEIVTSKDRVKRRANRTVMLIIIILLACAAVAAFHFLVMDLNVFWAKVQRRVSAL